MALPAVAATKAFDAPRAPVVRITGPDAPSAGSWVIEQAGVPQVEAVVSAVRGLVGEAAALDAGPVSEYGVRGSGTDAEIARLLRRRGKGPGFRLAPE